MHQNTRNQTIVNAGPHHNCGDVRSRTSKTSHALLGVVAPVVLSFCAGNSSSGYTLPASFSEAGRSFAVSQDAPALEVSKPIGRELKKGESHAYLIAMSPRQYVHIVVELRSLQMEAALYTPDGQVITAVTDTGGRFDEISISHIAEASGKYRLELRSLAKDEGSGRYSANVSALRAASGTDTDYIAGERAFFEGEQLRVAGGAQSHEKALEKFKVALDLWRKSGNRAGEIRALASTGRSTNGLGKRDQGLELLNQAVSLEQALGESAQLARLLYVVGQTLQETNKHREALERYQRALDIQQSLGERFGLAATLCKIGLAEFMLGNQTRALERLEQGVQAAREERNARAEADGLNTLGGVYERKGDYQRSLECFQQSVKISRRLGDGNQVLRVSSNVAYLSLRLGKRLQAREEYQHLLEMRRVSDPKSVPFTLVNIGGTYFTEGNYREAIKFYESAMSEFAKFPNREQETRTLSNLGFAYAELSKETKSEKDRELARSFFDRALPAARESANPRLIAEVLSGLGPYYLGTNDARKAVLVLNEALRLFRKTKEKPDEGDILGKLMLAWKAVGVPRLAILYGKQAVNTFQEIRANVAGFDKELQKSFVKAKERTYRELADLLITQRRLTEAQQVLALLKEEEYFQFIRRDHNEAPSVSRRALLTNKEEETVNRYSELEGQEIALAQRKDDLLKKKKRSPDEEAQLEKLDKDLEKAGAVFQQFLSELPSDFAGANVSRGKTAVGKIDEMRGLMEDLRALGPGAVALYTVVADKRYSVILFTPSVRVARRYSITADELGRKVFRFREAVQDPRIDPLPLAQDLFRILVGPVAEDLKRAHAKTLLWSLDGALRYLPIAALNDGQRYLVESYRNVIVTPASTSHLKDQPSANWRALGLGVSKAQPGVGAEALPAVPDELYGIIHEDGAAIKKGILPGIVMLDEAFTESVMRRELRNGYPLVHIASHFQFAPGSDENSFLLLGDGGRLTLRQINNAQNLFRGVELLTLSACNTATGDENNEGAEVENFGVLAQRNGAKAVIATLWSVADQSTSTLMQKFYKYRERSPGTSKSEALQQAQLALLKGDTELLKVNQRKLGRAARNSAKLRGRASRGLKHVEAELAVVDEKVPYAHPYYWAPFILIGNSR